MESELFVTVTGINHYYGITPFEIGREIQLAKEPDNLYDSDAIVATLPYIGAIGYVANSVHTVVRGTFSASRVYDRLGCNATAKVMFVNGSSAICRIVATRYAPKTKIKVQRY